MNLLGLVVALQMLFPAFGTTTVISGIRHRRDNTR